MAACTAYERLHDKENGNASSDPLSHPEEHIPSAPLSADYYEQLRDEGGLGGVRRSKRLQRAVETRR